jgi:hypothetical protein
MVIVAVRHHHRVKPPFLDPCNLRWRGETGAVGIGSNAGIYEYPGTTSLDKHRRPADLMAAAQHLNAQAAIRARVRHRPVSGPVSGLHASGRIGGGRRDIRHCRGVTIHVGCGQHPIEVLRQLTELDHLSFAASPSLIPRQILQLLFKSGDPAFEQVLQIARTSGQIAEPILQAVTCISCPVPLSLSSGNSIL